MALSIHEVRTAYAVTSAARQRAHSRTHTQAPHEGIPISCGVGLALGDVTGDPLMGESSVFNRQAAYQLD